MTQTKLNKEKEFRRFIKCACNTCMIDVSLLEFNEPTDIPDIHMGFWKYGHPTPNSWWNRLRHIWDIIRYGHPWEDYVIMRDFEAKRLVKTLQKMIGIIEQRKKDLRGLKKT